MKPCEERTYCMSGPWRMCRVWCSTLVSVPPKLGTDHRKFRPRPRPANMPRVSPRSRTFIRGIYYILSRPHAPAPSTLDRHTVTRDHARDVLKTFWVLTVSTV